MSDKTQAAMWYGRFDEGTDRLHAAQVSSPSRRPKARSAQQTGAPTIGDVAARAGVSKMSVSRVLRNPMTVSEPLRSRVQQAIEQLNYVPNRAAQLLSGTAQFRIGLLYNHPRSAYAVDLLLGAMDQAALTDIQLVVRGCTMSRDDAGALRDLVTQNIDAVVLTAPLCESTELIGILDDAKILAMLVGTSMQPAHGAGLHIDEYAAAYAMTRHIAGLGHTRIGFVKGGDALSASRQRFDGYRAALNDARIAYDDGIVAPGLFTYRSGLDAAERLLTRAEAPSAIFASNDDMAAAVVATAHRLGLDVPRDLTVCGFDDSWIATNIWPELTTVRQPVAAMGAEAIGRLKTMLVERGRGRAVPATMLFPHEIVMRGSDGGPPLPPTRPVPTTGAVKPRG